MLERYIEIIMEDSNLMKIIKSRRSVRRFTKQPVTDDELGILLEAARLAPSSGNTQPWRFVVVREAEMVEKLAKATPIGGSAVNRWLEKAPCIIVCCGKPGPVYHGASKAVLPADLMTMDIAIATEHIVLAAAEMELGTCWVGWLSEKKVKKLLGLPRSWKVVAMLAVGWPEKPLKDHEPNRKKIAEIAFRGKADTAWD